MSRYKITDLEVTETACAVYILGPDDLMARAQWKYPDSMDMIHAYDFFPSSQFVLVADFIAFVAPTSNGRYIKIFKKREP